MATRIVEGKKPYTGGKAINIDENKVISLRLRDENNLIIRDEGDNEIYVDLQLPDGIEPTDAFPVGVNTGRVLVADGWDKTGTLISAKTTSGDNIQILYADDGTLWIDNGTGTFKQIYFKADVDAIAQAIYDYIDINVNTKTFKLSSLSDLATAQEAYDWWKNGGYPILDLGILYLPSGQTIFSGSGLLVFTQPFLLDDYTSHSTTELYQFSKVLEVVNDVVVGITSQEEDRGKYLATDYNYSTPYTPQYDGSPATKKYVDNKITTSSTAPSNPTEGMLWYDTTNDELKVYDGTNWNTTGGSGDVQVSTDTDNLLSTGAKLWVGTESDFSSIVSPDSNTMYIQYVASGGGTTYSYDFRNKSSSDLSNDGWVVTGTLETGSNGITSPIGTDMSVIRSVGDLSSASKITITTTVMWNRDDNGKRAVNPFLIDTNVTRQNATGFGLATGYNTTKVSVTVNGTTTNGTDIGDIGQSTYTPVFEIDLVNKTLTGTVTGLGVSTLSLTDAQVTAIKSLTKLGVYTTQETFFIQDISITII